MKEQIETLIRLQQIETESERVRAELAVIPRKTEELENRLAAFETALTDAVAHHDTLRKTYRSSETDLQTNEAAIKKSRERLGTVKTNKEYQALIREIEDTKRRNARLEDEMLGLLDEIEAADGQRKEREGEMVQFREHIAAEKETLDAAGAALQEKLAGLDADRESVEKRMDPPILEQFRQVLKRVNGPAVVPVRGRICDGCNMNIPPQMRNELSRHDSLKFCPFCHRIMYWEEKVPE